MDQIDPISSKRLVDIAYATAFKTLRNEDVAKVIAQEAIAHLIQWNRTHGRPDVPEAWVSTVAKNLVRNHLRDRDMHASDEFRDDEPVGLLDLVSILFGDLRFVDGYSDLSARQRQVVDQLYGSDLDVATVAKNLGISKESVRTHRRRALKALRLGDSRGSGRGAI